MSGEIVISTPLSDVTWSGLTSDPLQIWDPPQIWTPPPSRFGTPPLRGGGTPPGGGPKPTVGVRRGSDFTRTNAR